jgi:hypothetical protein
MLYLTQHFLVAELAVGVLINGDSRSPDLSPFDIHVRRHMKVLIY